MHLEREEKLGTLTELDQELANRYGSYASYSTEVDPIQVGIEEGKVGVGGEVVEGMPPVEAGGLADGGELDGLEVGQRRDELLFESEKARIVVVEGLMMKEPGLVGSLEADVQAVEGEVKRE
jgi:hypothetical protein